MLPIEAPPSLKRSCNETRNRQQLCPVRISNRRFSNESVEAFPTPARPRTANPCGTFALDQTECMRTSAYCPLRRFIASADRQRMLFRWPRLVTHASDTGAFAVAGVLLINERARHKPSCLEHFTKIGVFSRGQQQRSRSRLRLFRPTENCSPSAVVRRGGRGRGRGGLPWEAPADLEFERHGEK